MQASVTIPGRHVKLFSKALSAISKIGSELVLELADGVRHCRAQGCPRGQEKAPPALLFFLFLLLSRSTGAHQQVNLQALNQARSAFVIFRFAKGFFSAFESSGPVKVAVPVKSCCAVFRATSSVEQCVVRLVDNALLFVLQCKQGVVKNYRLNSENSSVHRAVYNKMTPSRLVARPKLLADIVANFNTAVEEVTLVPLPGQIKLKTFAEENTQGNGKTKGEVLQTELVLDSADFDSYALAGGGGILELTFSLKELRSILGFCEFAGQPVCLFFSEPGSPILFSVNYFDHLVVDFVLATLAAGEPSQRPTNSQDSFGAGNNSNSAAPTPMSGEREREKEREKERAGEDDDEDDDECVQGTPERERKKARNEM